MQVLFRADASQRMGHGHVMRCLTLADALAARGARSHFACREHPGHLAPLIETRGHAVTVLPIDAGDARSLGAASLKDADDTCAVAARVSGPIDWIIADHYAIDADWEERISASAGRVMVIDDLANRRHVCELLLDQNLVANAETRYDKWLSPACARLVGPKFALLRPEYARRQAVTPVRSGAIRCILIAFGGADGANLTERALTAALDAVLETRSAATIDVVLSPNAIHLTRIEARARSHTAVRVHAAPDSLAPLIARADLAIGASGTTNWERLCLGLPTLVISTARNQQPIAAALHDAGLVHWLGDAADVSDAVLRAAIVLRLGQGADSRCSALCMATVDGRGADRVATILTATGASPLSARVVTVGDEALLLAWSNDPMTRAQGFSPEPIAAENHQQWLRRKLTAADTCHFYIVEVSDEPVGQVRFDRLAAAWEVHYSVSPAFRRRGIGAAMLACALRALARAEPDAPVIGHVKASNVASRRIFESLGFRTSVASDGVVAFHGRAGA